MPPRPGDTDPRRVRRRIAVAATVGFGGLAALVAAAGASGSSGHAARPVASGQSTAAQQRDAGQGMTLEQRLESQGAVPSSGQGYGFGQATQGQAPLVRSGAS